MNHKSHIKVQPICPITNSRVDGIGTYCNALVELFNDNDEVTVLPHLNPPLIESKLLNNLFRWKPFYQMVKQSDADIFHINGYTSFTVLEAFLVCTLLKKKMVYTPHWHPYKMLRRPVMGMLFFNLLIRPFLSKTKAVVTLNSEDSSYFAFLKDKAWRIPHWNRLNVEEECLNTPKKKDMILFIGRFNADNKGFEYLYHLPEGLYDIHCVGRGEVDKRSDMTIHTDIPVEELKSLYARASLVVIPSKYEAFSYVSLEALSFNTPVVMSNRVRIADYIRGCDGVKIFPYGNYQAFVDSVASTIGKPVAKEEILSKFSPETIRNKYISLYNTALLETIS